MYHGNLTGPPQCHPRPKEIRPSALLKTLNHWLPRAGGIAGLPFVSHEKSNNMDPLDSANNKLMVWVGGLRF